MVKLLEWQDFKKITTCNINIDWFWTPASPLVITNARFLFADARFFPVYARFFPVYAGFFPSDAALLAIPASSKTVLFAMLATQAWDQAQQRCSGNSVQDPFSLDDLVPLPFQLTQSRYTSNEMHTQKQTMRNHVSAIHILSTSLQFDQAKLMGASEYGGQWVYLYRRSAVTTQRCCNSVQDSRWLKIIEFEDYWVQEYPLEITTAWRPH